MAPSTSRLLGPRATIACAWVDRQQEKPMYVQPAVREMLHQAAQVYKQERGLQKEIYSQSLVRRKRRRSTMTVFLEKLEQDKKRATKRAAKVAGKRPAPSSAIRRPPIRSVHPAPAPLRRSTPPPRRVISRWQGPRSYRPDKMFELTRTAVEQYQVDFRERQAQRTGRPPLIYIGDQIQSKTSDFFPEPPPLPPTAPAQVHAPIRPDLSHFKAEGSPPYSIHRHWARILPHEAADFTWNYSRQLNGFILSLADHEQRALDQVHVCWGAHELKDTTRAASETAIYCAWGKLRLKRVELGDIKVGEHLWLRLFDHVTVIPRTSTSMPAFKNVSPYAATYVFKKGPLPLTRPGYNCLRKAD